MKFDLQTAAGIKLFTAYGEDYVAVDGVAYRRSLIVMPDRIVEDWPAPAADALNREDFSPLLNLHLDILLLGTGAKLRFPSPRLTAELAQMGIGLEAMDTFAACRTYNILAGEGRKVAAALLLGPLQAPATPA